MLVGYAVAFRAFCTTDQYSCDVKMWALCAAAVLIVALLFRAAVRTLRRLEIAEGVGEQSV